MIKFTYVAPLAPMVVSAVEDHFHISHGIEANAFLGCPQGFGQAFLSFFGAPNAVAKQSNSSRICK